MVNNQVAAYYDRSNRIDIASSYRSANDFRIIGSTVTTSCTTISYPGNECEQVPYEATIYFVSEDGSTVRSATSNSHGMFRVSLPKGTYIISQNKPLPEGFVADGIYVESYPRLMTTGPIEIPFEKRKHLIVEFDTGVR